jgi:O-antigen/teichoic acid export membrane protein
MSRILNASYHHVFFGLIYSKKTFKISQIHIYVASFSLAITFPLIWLYGIFGAVLASVISASVLCFLGYNMAKKYYFIPFEWNKILKMTLIMSTLYLFGMNLTISGTFVEVYLFKYVAPLIDAIGHFIFLDQIKNGKILNLIIGKLPIVVDGGLLLLYSLIFILGLVFFGIVPFGKLGNIIGIKRYNHYR